MLALFFILFYLGFSNPYLLKDCYPSIALTLLNKEGFLLRQLIKKITRAKNCLTYDLCGCVERIVTDNVDFRGTARKEAALQKHL
jgi:hypothetical protein